MTFQWVVLRFSAIFFFLGFLIDLELSIIFFTFFMLHIELGLYSIFFDYIHNQKISYFLNSLSKILLIENIIQIINFFF